MPPPLGMLPWAAVGVLFGILTSLLIKTRRKGMDRGHSEFTVLVWRIRRLFGMGPKDTQLQELVNSLEASVRQINHMRDRANAVCVIICKGLALRIYHIDDNTLNILAPPRGEDSDEYGVGEVRELFADKIPRHVTDLIPKGQRHDHTRYVERVQQNMTFPSSLMHPLRSVEVLLFDGSVSLCNISIGVLTKERDILDDDCYFYAMLCPVEKTEMAQSEEEKVSEAWLKVASMMYGQNVVDSVVAGNVPPPEEYEEATVLMLDIVNYTATCASRPPSEVAKWMCGVHKIVDDLLQRHSIRKLETRGDSCFCVSGTGYVPNDLSATQMSRMAQFAAQANKLLGEEWNTQIRVGIATGRVTVAYIGTHQFAPLVCAYGNTCDLAAKLETQGCPGLIRLSPRAALRLCDERIGWNSSNILRSHCDMMSPTDAPAVWFDCLQDCFVQMQGPKRQLASGGGTNFGSPTGLRRFWSSDSFGEAPRATHQHRAGSASSMRGAGTGSLSTSPMRAVTSQRRTSSLDLGSGWAPAFMAAGRGLFSKPSSPIVKSPMHSPVGVRGGYLGREQPAARRESTSGGSEDSLEQSNSARDSQSVPLRRVSAGSGSGKSWGDKQSEPSSWAVRRTSWDTMGKKDSPPFRPSLPPVPPLKMPKKIQSSFREHTCGEDKPPDSKDKPPDGVVN